MEINFMKTKHYVFFITIFVIGMAWVIYTDQVRNPKLMSLCPDYETETLHECAPGE